MKNYQNLLLPVFSLILALIGCKASAQTTESINAYLPESIRVAAPEKLVCTAEAKGFQVYQCVKKDDKFIWDLKGPEAANEGQIIWVPYTARYYFYAPK